MKTKKLVFLDVKNYFLGYIFPKMSKLTVFYLIFPKFFFDLFFEPHIFPPYTYKDPPAYYLFDFLDLITAFLDFLAQKTVF